MGTFSSTNLNTLHPRMLCAKLDWNWPSYSVEEIKLNHNFLHICASTHYFLHNYKVSWNFVEHFHQSWVDQKKKGLTDGSKTWYPSQLVAWGIIKNNHVIFKSNIIWLVLYFFHRSWFIKLYLVIFSIKPLNLSTNCFNFKCKYTGKDLCYVQRRQNFKRNHLISIQLYLQTNAKKKKIIIKFIFILFSPW